MDLEDVPAIKSWIRRGERRGLKRGLERGLKLGLEKAREKGFAKGLLDTRRSDLLTVLTARFGRVKKDLDARIRWIEDPTLLYKLIKLAAVAPTASRFSRELP